MLFQQETKDAIEKKKEIIISNTLNLPFPGLQRMTINVLNSELCIWTDFTESPPRFFSLFTGQVFRTASSNSQEGEVSKVVLLQPSQAGAAQRRLCKVFIVA